MPIPKRIENGMVWGGSGSQCSASLGRNPAVLAPKTVAQAAGRTAALWSLRPAPPRAAAIMGAPCCRRNPMKIFTEDPRTHQPPRPPPQLRPSAKPIPTRDLKRLGGRSHMAFHIQRLRSFKASQCKVYPKLTFSIGLCSACLVCVCV